MLENTLEESLEKPSRKNNFRIQYFSHKSKYRTIAKTAKSAINTGFLIYHLAESKGFEPSKPL